ncbi:MAG: hypothetical protein CMO81_00490 [Waddliaceae bacterium]|nr:hypothetical protein [Waddliaceae bacterium]
MKKSPFSFSNYFPYAACVRIQALSTALIAVPSLLLGTPSAEDLETPYLSNPTLISELSSDEAVHQKAPVPASGSGMAGSDRNFAFRKVSKQDGLRFKVPAVQLEYVHGRPTDPYVEKLMETQIPLSVTEDGFVAPREGSNFEWMSIKEVGKEGQQWFFASAVVQMSKAIVSRFRELGIAGVSVRPHPEDIHEGKDIRKSPDAPLRFLIDLPTIAEMHTVGSGPRMEKGANHVDSPLHRRILKNSPTGVGGYILDEQLNNYVHYLNRHPGRQVELAVSGSKKADGGQKAAIDYMVAENRPWTVFAHVANTGSGDSRFRETFGFRHNQLTENDDIFIFNYVTEGFTDYHVLFSSYEAPIGDSQCWRWRLGSSYYNFVSATVGIFDSQFNGDGYSIEGSLIWNFYNSGPWFWDLISGVRWQNIETNTSSMGVFVAGANENFFIPKVAVRVERFDSQGNVDGEISMERNFSSIAGTSSDVTQMGRADAEKDAWILKARGRASTWLSNWFDHDSASRSRNHLIETSFQGQWTFLDRVIPQFEMTAGGQYTVRGYREGTTVGDAVIVGGLEYRYILPHFIKLAEGPSKETMKGETYRHSPNPVPREQNWDLAIGAFVDGGRVVPHRALSNEARSWLLGVGVGAELSVDTCLRLRIDWGFALKDAGVGTNKVNSGSSRVHGSLGLNY